MTILKQLIEQMIGDYLNESYEDDLVESIFEEVSEETWEAIEEAILNELSPKTLTNYRKKAKKQAEKAWDTMKTQQRVSARADSAGYKERPGSAAQAEYDKKSTDAWAKARAAEKLHDKRGDGYNLAGKKLGL
jgi:Fe-S cluster biosynthesis and repair protein YggX